MLSQQKYGSWGWVNERELYQRVTGRKLRKLNVRPLVTVVDNFRNFTIALMALPSLIFAVEPTYPDEEFVGELIDDITFGWRNNGGVGTGFYRLSDADTGEELAYLAFAVAVGQARAVIISGLIMPNKDWNLKLEIGHLE